MTVDDGDRVLHQRASARHKSYPVVDERRRS